MNERSRRFAELYAADPNATEAAKLAGYSERTAYSQGQRLLKNVEVSDYIRKLQEKTAGERIADIQEVKELWTSVLRDKAEKTQNRLRAGELIAKASGEFVKVSRKEDDEDAEEHRPIFSQIALPYDYRGGPVNAIELKDGSITPLSGVDEYDILIYLPYKDYAGKGDDEDE